jgi:integrase
MSTRLWITKAGKPFSIPGFTKRLVTITQNAFGIPFRAHAFRHIAATSIATEDPEHARIIACILGHTSLQMADKHYNRARQTDAMTAHQKVIRRLRAAGYDEPNARPISL